jgi:hypothetical protein
MAWCIVWKQENKYGINLLVLMVAPVIQQHSDLKVKGVCVPECQQMTSNIMRTRMIIITVFVKLICILKIICIFYDDKQLIIVFVCFHAAPNIIN